MSPDIQPGLLPDPRPRLYATTEFLGRSPSEVLKLILENNLDITGGEYVTYPSSNDSDYDITSKSPIYKLTRYELMPTNLKSLSDSLNTEMNNYPTGEFDELGCEIVFSEYPQVVAVGSRVIADGSYMLIPMLDFASNAEDAMDAQALAASAISELGLTGYLLNSGNSFHFWGLNLMTPDQWRRMMVRCKESEEDRVQRNEDPVFDLGFVNASIDRDFAALRIFGYPPDKAEPVVVAVVN